MNTTIPRLVIAAPTSGCGKSTIATGLMAALSRRSVIQGFKVGPDYIDPGYHTAATGRASRNLDTWMLPSAQVRSMFAHAVSGADAAIIEGVMGLFDGYDARTESGSTAEVAKLLAAPVILVLDVGKMARSAGAMALGYRLFDPALNVAGVICNNTASERHATWVIEAIESVGLSVLGCIPRTNELKIPERHLGLHLANERAADTANFLAHAADLIEQHIDLDRLWALALTAPCLDVDTAEIELTSHDAVRVPIGVARDDAFCFYYEDNFDLLRRAGAEIIFFSPLHDATLPENIAGLYLGGGYPEIYVEQLAANVTMQAAVRGAICAGLPVYAECGGLMYLTQSITTLQAETFPMLGILPGRSVMQNRLTMGYRTLAVTASHPFLPLGERLRGHEFHYSQWIDCPLDLSNAYDIVPRGEELPRHEGFAKDNILASYVHLHFGTNAVFASNFVAACGDWQAETAKR